MKKLIGSILCLCMAFGAFAAAGCTPEQNSGSTPETGSDAGNNGGGDNSGNSGDNVNTDDKNEGEPQITPFSVEISATEDKINVSLKGADEGMEGDYDLVTMKSFEYAEGDTLCGLSKMKDAAGEEVGKYHSGQDGVVTLDRVKDGYDRLFNKFYLTKDGEAVKGPFYATDIYSANDGAPEYFDKIITKKGVLAEVKENVLDLGCQHATVNLDLNPFFIANETMNEDGTYAPVMPAPSSSVSFKSNGVTYYFNEERVKYFDDIIKYYSDNNIDVIAIVYMPAGNTPDGLSYAKEFGNPKTGAGAEVTPPIAGYNTSNSYGAGYWTAAMEFLASRYSGGEYGYVSTFVIGNEVDFSGNYYCIHKDPQPLEVFVEEYGRALRLANLAVKKYNPDGVVCTTFTHSWTYKSLTTDWLDYAYSVKDILDALNSKTKAEGDYDWGLTPHPYGYSLAATRIFEYDTGVARKSNGMTGDYKTSYALTFSNLEILDQYLNTDEMKFNGRARNVYLTESGISSSGYYGDNLLTDRTTDADNEELCQKIQAAAIAATWYKASQLDCIKVYSYYRMADNDGEGVNFTPGLVKSGSNGGAKKLSYDLWKYIDTQFSFDKANRYLEYLTWYDSEDNYLTYKNGDFDSYLDALDIFGTGFNFTDFDYSKAQPVKLYFADMKPVEMSDKD